MPRGRHLAPRTRTGRITWLSLGLALGLFLAMSIPAGAAGQASKATGSGYWTNGGGDEFYAEFNAHEAVADKLPVKGFLFQDRTDEAGGFTVDVDTVMVFETYACFGGNTDDAWGVYSSHLNDYRWTVVVDGGSGGEEVGADYLRGGWTGTAIPTWCENGGTANNEAWSGGNVQIHLGKSYDS